MQTLLAWWKGAQGDPRADVRLQVARCALIDEKRVTTMMGVPANYLFMAEEPAFATADLSSLRRAVVGGAPMPEALLDAWRERGVEIVQGYGLTEAAPNVLVLPPEDAVRKRGCAGKPYPHVDVELRDPETRAVVDGPGEGELVVRGPNVFAGYWRNAEATAATVVDGWLHTGDVARRDDEGYYRIVGRTKEVVISGGENVYPAEVENVLHEHRRGCRGGRRRSAGRALGRGGPRLRRAPRRGDRGGAARVLPRAPGALQGAEERPLRRRAAAERDEQGREGRPAGARGMTGKTLTARGQRTRRRLLEAAEKVFADVGYHEASIVKITESAGVGQGTFYLYFESKKAIFDELVLDLNARVRHAMTEAAAGGSTRAESELRGFAAFFRFTAEHPALYRVIRQAEFVSPETLHEHYERLTGGYVNALRQAMEAGEVAAGDPEVLAWSLMGIGELVGMRWILWDGDTEMPADVFDELARIIVRALGAAEPGR